MTPNPLSQPCLHLATSEEQTRDPQYVACNAVAFAPCVWARRYDGVADPAFHSERFEAAFSLVAAEPEAKESFDQAVLATGLI